MTSVIENGGHFYIHFHILPTSDVCADFWLGYAVCGAILRMSGSEFMIADAVVGAVQDMGVLGDVAYDKVYRFFVVYKQVKALDDFDCVLFKTPFEKGVNVLKVIVERLAVDVTFLYKLAYSHL